jgi:microcystin degradation protein MlrC
MKRIAITGISIECLERSPVRARYEDFDIHRGEQLFDGGLSFIPGMIDRLKAEAGLQICPLMWAGALPNGLVEASAYARLKGEMLARLQAEGPFEGVLISGHGALEVEGLAGHGESDYISAVRQAIGPRVPLGIALDLHGNITAEIARAGTVFDALRTAPHIDHQQTGWRTADQLLTVIKKGLNPPNALLPVPILISGEQAVTAQEPAHSLYGGLKTYDAIPGLLDVLLMVGFGFNDLPWCSMSVLATHASDAAVAARVARDLAGRVWSRRSEFVLSMETAPINAGVQCALVAAPAQQPVYLTDSGDNTTAGATGDLTLVLRELLEQRAPDAVVAGILAPKTVRFCQSAGVGSEIELSIGAEQISLPCEPFTVRAVVDGLGLGEGEWARLRIEGVTVTFHTRRVSVTTRQEFHRLGIDPQAHAIFVVKLGYLFPELAQIARRHILLLSPGVASLDFPAQKWGRVQRPIYPLDPAMTWDADTARLFQWSAL